MKRNNVLISLSSQNGKVLAMVLIFVFGILLGGVVVGEVVRTQYRGQGVEDVKDEDAKPPQRKGDSKNDKGWTSLRRTPIVAATEKVMPAVVSITVTQIQMVRDPFYNFDLFGGFFIPDFGTRYREVSAIGSGVIFDSLGHILTNNHVVENAAKIMVNLPDGREFKGELVGSDVSSDIAVVRIRGRQLPCAKLGSSNDLLLGETVIALGNPFGYLLSDAKPSVTTGVISALHRDFAPNPKQPSLIYKNMVQTDAAINRGNSGGALVNLYGEVIGINTFIVSPNQGSVGLGFAIPINKARKVARELIQFGTRRSYRTGLKIQDLDPWLAKGLGLSRSAKGVVVTEVTRTSAADKAGIKVGDVITAVNKEPIRNTEDIQFAFAEFFAGEKVYLIIIRGRKKLKVPLALETDKHQSKRGR